MSYKRIENNQTKLMTWEKYLCLNSWILAIGWLISSFEAFKELLTDGGYDPTNAKNVNIRCHIRRRIINTFNMKLYLLLPCRDGAAFLTHLSDSGQTPKTTFVRRHCSWIIQYTRPHGCFQTCLTHCVTI